MAASVARGATGTDETGSRLCMRRCSETSVLKSANSTQRSCCQSCASRRGGNWSATLTCEVWRSRLKCHTGSATGVRRVAGMRAQLAENQSDHSCGSTEGNEGDGSTDIDHRDRHKSVPP